MSEQGRTVSVSGLPTDLEEDRLTDKLAIHFLRSKNGGGEIASITISKTTPRSALITFEDSGVALSVLQHGPQFLEVDGKKHRLTLSKPPKDLDPNMVVLNMSVTVDYSQLPGGKATVTSLVRSHGLQVNYTPPETHCTLAGLYSHVQAALSQLLGLPGSPASKDTPPPVSGGSGRGRRSHTLEESGHGKTREVEHRDRTDQASHLLSADSDLHMSITSGGQTWEGERTVQVERGAVGLSQPELPPQVEEDMSLIMDADMFLYLQSLCAREYRGILAKHGVEAVDVTADGVTTLFLQRLPGFGDNGHEMAPVREARQALSQLYQENEARLRRAQLPKSILHPQGGLSRAMEGLRVRLPKLLLSDDERNVYIVGSSSDVSDAKQHLLLGEEDKAAEDVASLLRSPSSSPSSSKPGYDERLPTTLSSPAAPDTRLDRLLKGYEAERMVEGPRGYKFAARFKALGAAGLATRPKDAVAAADLSTSIRTAGFGPMLGQDVLGFERAGWGVGGLSMLERENSGGDSLLRRGDQLATSGKSLPDPNTVSGAKTTSSLSGSALKRASSFSGRVKPKVQETGQIETPKSRTRRSNSLERRHICSAEVTVPMVMWNYITEAYASRIKDITTDLQMRERQSDGSRDVTVTLKGAESSVVSTCQLELQKLVAMVQTDFCVQKLSLAELGVSDPEDETLAVCCSEVRQRFRRVSIQIVRDKVFLIGPSQLCSQVGEALREVFPGDPEHRKELENFSVPSTSSSNQPSPFQVNGDQDSTQFHTGSPQGKSEKPRGGVEEDINPQRRASTKTLENSESERKNTAVSQSPARKAAVIKERVGMGGALEADGRRHRDLFQTDTFLSHPAMGNEGRTRVNGGGATLPQTTAAHPGKNTVTPPNESDLKPTATQEDKDQTVRGAEVQGRSERSLERHGPGRCSQSGGAAPICVCGASGASVSRTGCGVALCQQCLLSVHVHCRVCPEAEVAMSRGILGNMSYSELPLSLPGNSRVTTLKITYCIPDGIQGENHPSPGSAFRGGVFEAYLPLCERTRKLLPCLERAFRNGLTFTVTGKEPGARVTWDNIPHKTSLQGGKSGNGYPDSSYLSRLSEALKAHGIEEAPATSEVKNKT